MVFSLSVLVLELLVLLSIPLVILDMFSMQRHVSDGTYYNAYELIVNNRQEIIDRSVAQIPVEHPDFYYPNDPQTGAWSRYKDAYRLIQKNRARYCSDCIR